MPLLVYVVGKTLQRVGVKVGCRLLAGGGIGGGHTMLRDIWAPRERLPTVSGSGGDRRHVCRRFLGLNKGG